MFDINLSNPKDFKECEKAAYEGTLNYESLNSAAYQYFHRLTIIGEKHRNGSITKDTATRQKNKAHKDYIRESEKRDRGVVVEKRYLENRLKINGLCAKINKATQVDEKLNYALEAIEKILNEEGFAYRAKINLKKEL